MAKFNRNIAEAAKGGGDAAGAFRALGISQQDLQRTSPDELFKRVSTGFASMEDGAGKTALAMALFGKSGAALIPLLNSGASGIEQMTEEARRFGVVIDTETGKRAEEFNDNLTRMRVAFGGIVTQIMSGALPGMVMSSEARTMTNVARSSPTCSYRWALSLSVWPCW